jgi:putative redox protein
MKKEEGVLKLETVEGDGLRFAGRIGERSLVLDSSPGGHQANPVQALLASIVACSAMDVVEILRKKRAVLTGYEVRMSGERAAHHPRRFVSIHYVHRITGRGLKRKAVEHALALSLEKYCSVSHCLRSDLSITHTIEIHEA